MSYSKKVIEYFNSVDTREQEDLANQIEEGAYDQELSQASATEKDIAKLVENLRQNNDLSPYQIGLIKKINHIGATIILAQKE